MMLPRATFDSDRSMTSGARPGRGQAKATGLVPNTALDPPHGAIAPGVLTNISATSPFPANRSTGWPAAPQWLERRIAAAAMPWLRAASGSAASANSIAGKAKPLAASTTIRPGRGRVTNGLAVPSIFRTLACAAYIGTREKPWPLSPSISAAISARATLRALSMSVRQRVSVRTTSPSA